MLSTLFVLLAASNFTFPALANHNSNVTVQEPPVPLADDGSEIGSTDGILIMGVVIVLIVTIPLLVQKKK